ncbi:hypothetical protein COT42_03695 [Candidatus Saganbacteria bacterium CG08_land_8_20_14_0_20_45_16]|uniref:TPM domain-containing protein n=1 Tax=Candidatus Saganbacteria bacterium CG08_land_8_20_14_0_20_45_16 TaxID=2014293 RepID=A0A2H0XZ47_UNCSA|nr:MAG: hypothetical protein COT42_03695 [Candidatus Saganbacteria bacterium CG08_land_8_20_14_0_20_45_16]
MGKGLFIINSNMRKTLVVCFILLMSLLGIVLAEVSLPNYSGYINDYANILSPSDKQALEKISQELKKQTGAELAVVIVKSVAPLDSKTYAVKLFEKWGIGEKDKDNGGLILLAMAEHRIEIEVGYGLEGTLPDAKAGRILDTYAIPDFKEGNYSQGLIATSKAVSQVVKGETVDLVAGGQEDEPGIPIVPFTPLPTAFLIAGVLLVCFLFRKWVVTLSVIICVIIAGLAGGFWGAVIGIFIGLVMSGFTALASLPGGGRGSGSWRSGSSRHSRSHHSFGGGRSGGGGAGRSW